VEIRIYYEVYEQANHFLRRAIERAIGDLPIRLVKLTRVSSTSVVAESIRVALHFKDPDALITWVEDGVERPLAFIEFSTAVETEDHDLQRFDAFLSAAMAGAPIIKIYASRQSRSTGYGGNLNYDRALPFRVMLQHRNTPAFQITWPLADAHTAARHDEHIACPPDLDEFDELLRSLWEIRNRARSVAQAVVEDEDELPQSARDLLKSFRQPIGYELRAGSTRLFEQDGDIVLKFNRWGHAMDPERGMAWFYHAVFDRKLVGHLTDKTALTTADAYDNFCRATGFDRDRLHEPNDAGTVDVTQHLAASVLSRPGLSIFTNCRKFCIHSMDGDLLVDLEWTGDPPVPHVGESGPTTKLRPAETLSEDEVTYVVAHDVLRPNGFQLLALSYPGDQGSFALLTGDPGRTVRRSYIDVIAFRRTEALSLTESKGPYNTSQVEEAVEKVLIWRVDDEFRTVLTNRVGEVVEYGGEPIIVSVAFADRPVRRLTSRLNDLDYFVIVGADRWRLWASDDTLPFAIREGSTSLVERWRY
jgi:hypothetical protein